MLGKNVDYNLLRPLQALLEERSVTRAAERLHVSQPTMSIHLSRLRSHFGDPLLIRRGAMHDLTPLGTRLLTLIPTALGETERLFGLQEGFDPSTSSRSFTVAAIDFTISSLGPAIMHVLQKEAPKVQFEFVVADPPLVDGAPETLRSIDGIVLPHGYFSEQPHLEISQDSWVCVIDAESPLGDEPSASELLERQWVHTLSARNGMTPARRQLQIKGIDVNVAAVTPFFHTVPSLVKGTDLVALMPESLARRISEGFGDVRVVPAPFDLDPVRDAFWWHPDHDHDPAHQWLRSVLERVRGM